LSLVLLYMRRSWPGGLASWVYYILLLAPVLGFAQSGPQFVADRYTYLSCLSWTVLAGAGLGYFWRAKVEGAVKKATFVIGVVVATLVPIGLGVLTWDQAQVWHDSDRLWGYAFSVTGSALAQNNLGTLSLNRGELGQAVEHFQHALRLSPDYA